MAVNVGLPDQAGLAHAAIGESLSVPIQRSSDFMSVRADLVSSWALPSGDLTLNFLAFQAAVIEVLTTVSDAGDGRKALQPHSMNGAPVIFEIGTVRMPPSVALEAAVGILRNSIQNGLLTKEQIQAAFKAVPLDIS
jgi:hypothetical protein